MDLLYLYLISEMEIVPVRYVINV